MAKEADANSPVIWPVYNLIMQLQENALSCAESNAKCTCEINTKDGREVLAVLAGGPGAKQLGRAK